MTAIVSSEVAPFARCGFFFGLIHLAVVVKWAIAHAASWANKWRHKYNEVPPVLIAWAGSFRKGAVVVREEKARPGVMIYFEDFEAADESLTDEQMGRFIRAIVHYAKDGEWDDFKDDPILHFAMKGAKPKIDRDGERYSKTIMQRKYAVYVREQGKKGIEPLSFEEWSASTDITRHQPITTDIGRYPTTTTTATPITTTNTTAVTRGCKGEEDDDPFSDWHRRLAR